MQIEGMHGNRRLLCGNFYVQSTILGGTKTDVNGEGIEELL